MSGIEVRVILQCAEYRKIFRLACVKLAIGLENFNPKGVFARKCVASDDLSFASVEMTFPGYFFSFRVSKNLRFQITLSPRALCKECKQKR